MAAGVGVPRRLLFFVAYVIILSRRYLAVDNARPETISYYEHEAEVARATVNAERWALAAIFAFIILSVDVIVSKLKRTK
jgi:hypothetical protein